MAQEKGQVHTTRIQLKLDKTPSGQPQVGDPIPHRRMSVIAVLAIVLFFLFWGSLLFIVPYKQWGFSPAFIFETVKRRFEQLFEFLFHGSSPFGITVYQYLAVILVGAALAACGTIFQGSFRNMLAGPSTMGVMSGGTLGLLIYLLLFSSAHAAITFSTFDAAAYQARSFFDIYARQIFTLAGCFGGVGLTMVVSLAAGRGRLSASTMIVCGSVFSSLTSSAMSLVQYYMILKDPTDERIELLRDLNMGTFDNITTWQTLVMLAVPILICLAILLILRHRLNLLSLREDEAATMGVNIYGLRIGMIAIGTILTAVVVAFCGHIGFLGFMIPLVGRKLVGPNMEKLLPVSMLIGAILLMIVFDIASIAMLTSYLNLFTSFIGGLVLLVTLLKKGGSNRAAV
ncbi:MAG: FecCD family ABC transporter permease [Oscillospiraceae bacterium]